MLQQAGLFIPSRCVACAEPVEVPFRNVVIELVEMPAFPNLLSAPSRPSPTLRQAQGAAQAASAGS